MVNYVGKYTVRPMDCLGNGALNVPINSVLSLSIFTKSPWGFLKIVSLLLLMAEILDQLIGSLSHYL